MGTQLWMRLRNNPLFLIPLLLQERTVQAHQNHIRTAQWEDQEACQVE